MCWLFPLGWFRSLGWGVSHAGSPSSLGSILHVHQVDPQVLHVVLYDVDPLFFSVFPYSVVHVRLPPRFSWHNPFLLGIVHAQTISTWPPVLCQWCTLVWGCDGYRHSFSCFSTWGRESILAFSFRFSSNVLLHAFSMTMFLNHRSILALSLFCILSL